MLMAALLSLTSTKGQETKVKKTSIGISYQKIDLGRGAQIDIAHILSKRWWGQAGLYIHSNSLPRDDQNHSYYNRGWAIEWPNHFGANISLNYNFLSYRATNVYAFYNAHITNLGTRDKIYEPVIGADGTISHYILEEGYLGNPFTT